MLRKEKVFLLIYKNALNKTEGISFIDDIEGVTHNYFYFPILILSKKYGKFIDQLY